MKFWFWQNIILLFLKIKNEIQKREKKAQEKEEAET
jgi:hypothetical protein